MSEEIRMTLSQARCYRGLSQEEASELIGVSTATLSSYERGVTYPTAPILRRMSKVYKMTFEQFIFAYEVKR